MKVRPLRQRLPDFAGRMISLPDGPESWQILRDGADLLLMGLGPDDPGKLGFVKKALREGKKIYWLEAPGMQSPARFAPPPAWIKLHDSAEAQEVMPFCQIAFYKPGLRVAPRFWGPLLAKAAFGDCHGVTQRDLVWLPGDSHQLLHSELITSLGQLGYRHFDQAGRSPEQMLEILRTKKPAFGLSVNFRGLDGEGRIFELCRAAGIPVAIWIVDNPWNLLSAVGLPWWQDANLFITDKSFIPELREYGAKNITFLPLAASSHMFQAKASADSSRPVFVGRSAFPAQQKFFSGVDPAAEIFREACSLLPAGSPDFHWWQEKMQARLWPGADARRVSLGADRSSSQRRAAWISVAAKDGIRLVGDPGWRKLLPDIPVLPPVDYYGPLADLYASSAWTLNVTSLLLPESLNQRHFDVWAAGGFLLTDQTRGLELFPPDLVKPVACATPADLAEKSSAFSSRSSLKKELATAWRSHILEAHTYEQRLRTIMDALGIAHEQKSR